MGATEDVPPPTRADAPAVLGIVAAVLAGGTACDPMVAVSIDVRPSDQLAAAYDAEAPGMLIVDPGPLFAPAFVPPVLCGDTEARRFSRAGIGCRPEHEGVVVRAWIVPAPPEWLGEGADVSVCDADGKDLSAHPKQFRWAAIPAPTDADPHAEVEARWGEGPWWAVRLARRGVSAARNAAPGYPAAMWCLTFPLAAAAPPADPEPLLGPPLAHTTGVLVATRAVEAALWPEPFARPAAWGPTWLDTLRTPPTFDPRQPAFGWDGDPPAYNLLGHGLLGAELYYRPRRCGLSVAQAALFAFAASTAWEYVFEGNARAASAQDLVYTPLAGVVLGELRFRAVRDLSPRYRWVPALLDPLGQVERGLGAAC